MIFGIQAGQTVVLSRIVLELDEGILLKKTAERLSRHLFAEGQDRMVQEGGMPLLAKVWDGSKGRVGDNLGYNLCFAAAGGMA